MKHSRASFGICEHHLLGFHVSLTDPTSEKYRKRYRILVSILKRHIRKMVGSTGPGLSGLQTMLQYQCFNGSLESVEGNDYIVDVLLRSCVFQSYLLFVLLLWSTIKQFI